MTALFLGMTYMMRHADKVDNNRKNAALRRRIQTTLMRKYDTPIMNNVYRADYVECLARVYARDRLVAYLDPRLGLGRMGLSAHVGGPARGQAGRGEAIMGPRDIRTAPLSALRHRAPHRPTGHRTGADGWTWTLRGVWRNLYVFAWHNESRDGYADHRDANQWLFFVVAEQDLPKNRKSIGLTGLNAIVSPCRIADLKHAVENACPAQGALKAALEHV